MPLQGMSILKIPQTAGPTQQTRRSSVVRQRCCVRREWLRSCVARCSRLSVRRHSQAGGEIPPERLTNDASVVYQY